jgi:putative oxidoreductase
MNPQDGQALLSPVLSRFDAARKGFPFMNRFKSICGWVLQSLLALLFAIQGFVKLRGSPGWISLFRKWGYPDHFYFVVGLVELLGAILLVIPRLAKWGALILLVTMIGATATLVIRHEHNIVVPVVPAMLLAIVLYLRWGATAG